MPKDKLIAMKRTRYGGRMYNEGETFEASRNDSQVLRLIKHAKMAPLAKPAPVVPPPVATPAPAVKPPVPQAPKPTVTTTEVKADLTAKPEPPKTEPAKHDGKKEK